MENAVSRTAYYTMAIRAKDARMSHPICGDHLAHLFMNEDASRVWQQFKKFKGPNLSNVARHRILDDLLRTKLEANSSLKIIIIGAGFDTRAFRLPGGQWFEVDEPAVLSLKDSLLPTPQCSNSLTRIPIRFGQESLERKLTPLATSERVIFVIEGVLMYLKPSERVELLKMLARLFPNHTVLCDLMSRSFFNTYSKKIHQEIMNLGATFSELDNHPENLFTNLDYRMRSAHSIALRAAELAPFPTPTFLLRWFLTTLRDGYRVWVFDKCDKNQSWT